MCAQEVMNIEEQCAEHFRFTRKAATEQIQNFCHGVATYINCSIGKSHLIS